MRVAEYIMFHMMRNNAISETQMIDTVAAEIRRRLPPRWNLLDCGKEINVNPLQTSRLIADAVWKLRSPDGFSSDIIIEVKRNPVEPASVNRVADQIRSMSFSMGAQAGATPAGMLISPYLSPRARERLTEAGISYADSTGNIRFALERPAVYIESHGADKNPFTRDNALRSLKGGRAARVVRALLDYQPPFGTRELAGDTANSAAMISRVCGLLEPEDIISKENPRGRIIAVDWEALANRWALDYEFASSNVLTTWLEPRGAKFLFARLPESGIRYAVTGSFASYRLAPIAELRLATLYVDDPETAARQLRLRPAETGGNVILARPFDPVVFERADIDGDIAYASPTQVLVDLMTGTGRSLAEAEALKEWMRENEETWKVPMTRPT